MIFKNSKNVFLLLLALSTSNFAKIFVPKMDSFVEKKINIEKKSINNICQHLGYNTEQFHAYMDYKKIEGKITAVIFKVFTETIICVITDDKLISLSKIQIDDYLSNFSFVKEYDSYEIESILKDGVDNQSLTSKYLEDIFSQNKINKNGSFIATKIGYELYFTNGVLTSFNSSDGLNKWAKQWKTNHRELFNKYVEVAKKYWGKNQVKILNEINTQASAYASTPDAAGNEYVKFHITSDGIINFKMLMVAHYNDNINLLEFKEINHGRYKFVDEFSNSDGFKRTTYKVNKTLFTFDKNSKLVNSYTSK